MITIEELFVEHLNILAQGVHQQDKLDALPIAAALRQLLLDASPLIHQVNRKTRLRLRFRVNRQPANTLGIPAPIIELSGHALDPNTIQFQTGTEDLSLEEFLRFPVAKTKWGDVSVHELVDYLCHKAGAVHRDRARTLDDQGLEAVFGALEGIQIQPLVSVMEAIVRVVLVALLPLRDAVWRPPKSLPIFAHYRQPPGRRGMLAADGGHLVSNLDYRFRNGFAVAAVLTVPRATGEQDRYVYEIGTPRVSAPRVSLLITASGQFVFRVRPSDSHEIAVSLPHAVLQKLMRNGLTLIAEVRFEPQPLVVSLFDGARKVAEESARMPLQPASIQLQTLGASLEGEGRCAIVFHDLVLIESTLTTEERAGLTRFLEVPTRAT